MNEKKYLELSEYVGDIDGLGTLRILNGIKKMGDKFINKTRFFSLELLLLEICVMFNWLCKHFFIVFIHESIKI